MEVLDLRIGIVFLAGALIAVLLGVLFSRHITKSIKELTVVASSIGRGSFEKRIKVSGKSEIAQLGEAFNSMSEKLENLDRIRNEFISSASHELKTPLSSVKILSESLLYQPFDEKIYKEFLKDINTEVDRMSAIISDLLSLVHMDNSSSESLARTQVDLAELTGRIVDSLQPMAKLNKVELQLVVKNNAIISGDPVKLRQAFINLIDNAIKYTPENGNVAVTVSKEPQWAIVSVKDTGIGIPQKEQLHVFDRFYRVDKARARYTGGTGLGLSIVKTVVSLHEGIITLDSLEGEGSEFVVRLPYGRIENQ